jgi:hypothetical protein
MLDNGVICKKITFQNKSTLEQMQTRWLLTLLYVTIVTLTIIIKCSIDDDKTTTILYTDEYIAQFNDTGIRTLFNLFKDVKCEHYRLGHCKPGTVQVDPWLQYAIKTQYYLAQDEPINLVQFPASHNAFNDRSDGYGAEDNLLRIVLRYFFNDTDLVIAQQEYSMTDQLNFGVRVLHLDPQWFLGKMVLCHAGTTFPWFDRLLKIVEDILHKKFEYSSDQLGCTPSDRLWAEGIKEISDWINTNTDEIVILYINDSPKWDWGHSNLVVDPMKYYFGKLIFTPEDLKLFNNKWPSMRKLKELGKRVILIGSGEYITKNNTIIHIQQWTGYPDNNVNKFIGWPTCSIFHGEPYDFSDWNCVSGESQVLGSFYDGPNDMGLILPDNIQDFLDCGVKIVKMDQISPKLVQNMIWTWAENEPKLHEEQPCVYIQANTDTFDPNHKGTWYSADCSLILPVACENIQQKGNWTLGKPTSLVTFDPPCPPGFQFSVPTNPYHSRLLRDQIKTQGYSFAWLQYRWK